MGLSSIIRKIKNKKGLFFFLLYRLTNPPFLPIQLTQVPTATQSSWRKPDAKVKLPWLHLKHGIFRKLELHIWREMSIWCRQNRNEVYKIHMIKIKYTWFKPDKKSSCFRGIYSKKSSVFVEEHLYIRLKGCLMVSKRCRRCNKAVDADPEACFCVCHNCRALMSITKTLSDGGSGNTHSIRLKVVR